MIHFRMHCCALVIPLEVRGHLDPHTCFQMEERKEQGERKGFQLWFEILWVMAMWICRNKACSLLQSWLLEMRFCKSLVCTKSLVAKCLHAFVFWVHVYFIFNIIGSKPLLYQPLQPFAWLFFSPWFWTSCPGPDCFCDILTRDHSYAWMIIRNKKQSVGFEFYWLLSLKSFIILYLPHSSASAPLRINWDSHCVERCTLLAGPYRILV